MLDSAQELSKGCRDLQSLHLEIVLLHPSFTQWQALLQTQNRMMQSAALEHLNVGL